MEKNIFDGNGGFYTSEEANKIFKDDKLNRMNLIFASRLDKQNKGKMEDNEEDEDLPEDTGWEDLDKLFSEEEPAVPSEMAEQKPAKDVSEDLKTLLGMFNTAGIKVRVTSGYREGAKTKQGHVSHHSTGNAMDIVPEDGDFVALAAAIRNNPEISAYMKEKGLGILDETSKEMMERTGATGAHFHIGPDKIAQDFWKV